MRAHFGLPSVEAEDKEGKPPISVKFEIPYFTTSGIQVRPQGFQDPEQLWTGPTGPCRDPESVQASRVAGDTQQCNQLRKAFLSACPRRHGPAPALPPPWAAWAPTERDPHLPTQTCPALQLQAQRCIWPPKLEFEPLASTHSSQWGPSSWAPLGKTYQGKRTLDPSSRNLLGAAPVSTSWLPAAFFRRALPSHTLSAAQID